jgi:hypothetical protein
LTTVQGLPKKFDQKKILKVIKKQFACNGTIVADSEMGEVIQLQGDQRKDIQDFLTNKKEGLGLDAKTIKVSHANFSGSRFLNAIICESPPPDTKSRLLRNTGVSLHAVMALVELRLTEETARGAAGTETTGPTATCAGR